MAWSRDFQKCIICHFLDKFFFANIFTIKLDFAIKNSIFANLQIFLADSKSRAQELSNDVSFVIFGHKTWDLEGGGQIDPPQHILVFKYPSRDRVNGYSVNPVNAIIYNLYFVIPIAKFSFNQLIKFYNLKIFRGIFFLTRNSNCQ